MSNSCYQRPSRKAAADKEAKAAADAAAAEKSAATKAAAAEKVSKAAADKEAKVGWCTPNLLKPVLRAPGCSASN
jgi:hypothetical protein